MNATLARLTRLTAAVTREPDGRLLDAFLRGSQPAFRELVTRHGPLVFAVCNRVLRHRQDAEDAFQAAFLVLARRAADVWPRDAVGSWLYGVAYRVALKARAMRTRRQGREQLLEDTPAPLSEPPEPDTAEVIDRAIRKLPELYRAAVVACDLEGLSRREAAEQLGWKEGTLSGRLARARQLLAERLRKSGLSLPAGGLAVALGTDAPVRAALTDAAVEMGSGHAAAGVPAPVAALTEGVVPGMFAFKLKAAAVAMVLACGLGYGAWAAGSGDEPDGTKAPGGPVPLAAAQPPTKPKGDTKLPAGAAAQPPTKVDPDLQLLQGRWRIRSITEGGKTARPPVVQLREMEISGNNLVLPFQDSSASPQRLEFKIAVDATKQPKTIDLIASGKPVGKGIYELTALGKTCATCHQAPWKDIEPVADLVACPPAARVATGLKLAIATSGPRPEKFGSKAEGVIEFALERVGTDPQAERNRLVRERARLEAFLAAMEATDERKAAATLRLATIEVEQAKAEEELARRQVDIASELLQQAQVQVNAARVQLAQATKNLKDAEDKLAAAKKGAPPPQLPAKDGDVFTVHVRPLAAPEKVIRVKATGNPTVLEGLAYAAEDMAIKPDAVTVWVVRDKAILSVDLAAITQRGETKTNYALKAGDQLFVQVKVGK